MKREDIEAEIKEQMSAIRTTEMTVGGEEVSVRGPRTGLAYSYRLSDINIRPGVVLREVVSIELAAD